MSIEHTIDATKRAAGGAVKEIKRLDDEIARLEEELAEAERLIARAVELMTPTQVGQWEGVRAWQERGDLDGEP